MTPKAKNKPVKRKKNPESAPVVADWHKKIAQSRGESWRRNVLKGRQEATLKPSALKIARAELGMAQDPVAKRLGLTKSVYGSIERGKRSLGPVMAQTVAKMLSKPLEVLFVGNKDGNFIARFVTLKI